MVNVDFELKVQKHDSHLRFMLTTLIHIESTVPLNIIRKIKRSAFLTLIPLILVSEGVQKTEK